MMLIGLKDYAGSPWHSSGTQPWAPGAAPTAAGPVQRGQAAQAGRSAAQPRAQRGRRLWARGSWPQGKAAPALHAHPPCACAPGGGGGGAQGWGVSWVTGRSPAARPGPASRRGQRSARPVWHAACWQLEACKGVRWLWPCSRPAAALPSVDQHVGAGWVGHRARGQLHRWRGQRSTGARHVGAPQRSCSAAQRVAWVAHAKPHSQHTAQSPAHRPKGAEGPYAAGPPQVP